MKKYLLFISSFLLFTALPLCAQNDASMQAGEGALMGHNYSSAENNFTTYINSISGMLPVYMKKKAMYDTCNGYQRNTLLKDFSINHNWALAFYDRGISRTGLGSKDSALADFESAIKIDPGYAEAYYQAALIKKDKGDKTGTCIYIGRARFYSDTMRVVKNAYSDNFCWMCGYEYFKKGRDQMDLKEYTEALTSLNMAILISPDSASYYAYRAGAYNGLNNLDSASADYSRAIKLDSNNYMAYYQRSLSFEKKQKYQEAFMDLSMAIRLNPRFLDAYIHRAEDSELMEKEASAQYDYQQIIRLKPNYGDAYYKIALYKVKLGQDACADFHKALDLGVDDAQGYVDDCEKAAKKDQIVK
jgi:tetratricopeptide (TPR) repeat protein